MKYEDTMIVTNSSEKNEIMPNASKEKIKVKHKNEGEK